MNCLVRFGFLCALVALSAMGQIQWDNNAPLGTVMHIYWKKEGPDSMIIEMQGKTPGYVSVGISPSGTMFDADIFVGWVKNNQGFVQDRWSHNHSKPVMDAQQDLKLLDFSETPVNGQTLTKIRFSRKLNTADTNDLPIKAGPTTIIWAWNDLDPENPDDIKYHQGNRNSSTVNFF